MERVLRGAKGDNFPSAPTAPLFKGQVGQFPPLPPYSGTPAYNMNFNLHITEIVKKPFRIVGFTKRIMKPFSVTKVLLTLYNHYICSRLDYCSLVRSPKPQHLIDKIERVQKKLLNTLLFNREYNVMILPFELCNRGFTRVRYICTAIVTCDEFHRLSMGAAFSANR